MPSVTKLRRELLQKFKGWSVVAQGELDQRGDDFDSDLSGHDPYMEFLDAKDEQFMVATTLRPPGNLEKNFSKLGDGERKQLTVESGMAKIRYREALVQEYKEILDIEHLPFEFQLSGKAAKELRSDFVERAANASELSPPNNKRMWGTLCREELEAAKKLKGVLDELVEVACCGPDLASIYEERDYDDFAYTCQHAAKALTPFLPLCSDEQLGRLAKLLGHSDGGGKVLLCRQLF